MKIKITKSSKQVRESTVVSHCTKISCICAGITCHLHHNGRRRAKRPRTLALASLLSSLSSLQDSRDFSSPRKDLVLGRDGGIGT